MPTQLLDPVAHDVRSRMFGLAFWVVLPLIALTAVGHGVQDYRTHAHRPPPGVSGVFLVTNRSCFGNVCQSAGTFTSDNGTLREPNLLGDYRWNVGERHRAAYKPDTGIISLAARFDPTPDVLGTAGGLLYLMLWGYFLLSWVLGLRHRPPPAARR